jgi:hypothetical protein
MSPGNPYLSLLMDLRRDLGTLQQRVDDAIQQIVEGAPVSRPTRQFQLPVTQTPDPEFNFRGNPEGLRHALVTLHDRVSWVENNLYKFNQEALHQEMCLLVAKARLFQGQSEEGSREWETAVGVIRTIGRIVAAQKPGFVYGLAITHNTDWGAKVRVLRAGHTPID